MNTPNPDLNRHSGRPNRILIVLLVLVLVWAIWRWVLPRGFDWALFARTFKQMDPVWLVPGAILTLLTFFGRALRWKEMIRPIKPDASLSRLMWATTIGFSAAVLMGRAGEFVRPYLIARDQRLSISSQLAVWFLERLTDLVAVLVIFGIALVQLEDSVTSQVGPQIRWVLESGGKLIAAIGGISLVLLIAFRSFSEAASRRVRDGLGFLPDTLQDRIGNIVEAFARGMEATRDGRTLTIIILLSFIEWALIEASFYCIFKGFPSTSNLTVMDTLVILGFVSFGSIVQIPGVGGGMQVVTIVVLTQLFGVGLEQATAAATVLWVIGFAIIVPPGVFLAFRSHLHWRDLQKQV